MKRLCILLASCFLFITIANAEDPGQVYFTFQISKKAELDTLTKMISIDKVTNNSIFAYANNKQFAEFKKLNYYYKILPNPGDLYIPGQPLQWQKPSINSAWEFDAYPTYAGYVAIMNQFASMYPNLCQIEHIGLSVRGHELLVARITNNVMQDAIKPQVLFTGSVHGDETGPFIVSLKLIDYLLSNYSSNQRVANILNNTVAYILPLENPDGAYFLSDNSLQGCRRYNANGVDLNRNMPSTVDGLPADGNDLQPENQAIMGFLDSHDICLSGDIHAGLEVAAYPWFGWTDLHADDLWYSALGRKYATDVQTAGPTGYFTDENNGIVKATDAYIADGTKADYVNYWKRGREIAIEISHVKVLPESDLISHWNSNYNALLGYIEQALFGIRGVITDASTGLPLAAAIEIPNHDNKRSGVISSRSNGGYYRNIAPGVYTVVIRAPGFTSQTFYNISVSNGNATTLNAALSKIVNPPSFKLSYTGATFLGMNNSTGNLYLLGVNQTSPHTGLKFLSASANALAVDKSANLTVSNLLVNQGTFLNAQSNLTGGIIIKDNLGVVQAHCSSSGVFRVRGAYVPGFTDPN